MSEKNPIDELFRNELDNKGMSYSPQHWEQMESLIIQKKKKGLARGLWLGAALLLLISALCVTLISEEKTALQNSPSKDTNTPQTESGIKPATKDAAQIPSSNTGSGQSALPPTGQPGVAEVLSSSNKLSSLPYTHTEKTGKNPTEQVHLEGKKETAAPPFMAQKSSEDEVPPLATEATQSAEEKTGSAFEIPLAKEEELSPPIMEMPAIISSFEQVPLRPADDLAGLLKPSSPKKPELPSPPRPSLLHWYLETYADGGWISHRNDKDIRSWKNGNEKTGLYTEYGLSLRATKGHFSLSSGAGIRQWTELTNYTRENHHYTFDTSFKMVKREFIKRPDGTFAALIERKIDTTSHTMSTTVDCKDCPVNFRYITVPLNVQYEFGKGRWHYFTGAGVNISFLSRVNGAYALAWDDTDGTNGSMRTGIASGMEFSKTTLQARLNLGLKYRINPALSVHTQVRCQRSLGSMMQYYRQESDFYSIGFGLEWFLY